MSPEQKTAVKAFVKTMKKYGKMDDLPNVINHITEKHTNRGALTDRQIEILSEYASSVESRYATHGDVRKVVDILENTSHRAREPKRVTEIMERYNGKNMTKRQLEVVSSFVDKHVKTSTYPTASASLREKYRQVWVGRAKKTRGGLTKSDLKQRKDGVIVSKRSSERPLSPYLHFFTVERQELLDKKPKMSFTEVGRKIGRKWRDMNDEERRPYVESSIVDANADITARQLKTRVNKKLRQLRST